MRRPHIIFSDGEWELTSAEWRSPELLAWLFNESPVRDEVVIDDRWGNDTRHKHGGYYTTEYTSGHAAARILGGEPRHGLFVWLQPDGDAQRLSHRPRTGADADRHREPRRQPAAGYRADRARAHPGDHGGAAGADGRLAAAKRRSRSTDTQAWEGPRQWSAGKFPSMEEKEFMAEYDITKMVDAPPAGFARVEAFFTAKGETVYVILPRWPEEKFVLRDAPAGSGAKISLLGSDEPLRWRAEGEGLTIEIPPRLRANTPEQEAYVLKMRGLNR